MADNGGLSPLHSGVPSTGRPRVRRGSRSLKNEVIKPDVVVFCTGYRQEFPFFAKQNSPAGKPYALANEADVRGIWHHDDPTIGFIGYLRPNLGAIPPLAEAQAQLWVVHLLVPEMY
ncbi:hypothetical protein QBC34DRAFT_375012 [Podospora aff. communis PSN243]|uniref:Uncharacterized protein n=1 Tax=Podospora aff. communis PSN243 TaxID=3040156 RepID=A0AAV9H1T9_9PEZI|nr:hypothetical protein QBC34DRAFT_375012 [Podospora aff. communis PSN243]